MKKLLMILLFVYGCSSTETIIKDRKIEITIPAVKDTLTAVYVEMPKAMVDTLEYFFEKLNDESYIGGISNTTPQTKIKYYTKKKFFSYEVEEYKVDTTVTDTVKNIIVNETSTAEKIGYMVYGIATFVIVVVLLYIFGGLKWKI